MSLYENRLLSLMFVRFFSFTSTQLSWSITLVDTRGTAAAAVAAALRPVTAVKFFLPIFKFFFKFFFVCRVKTETDEFF